MKRKAAELSKKERIETLDALYTAAGSLRGREAMRVFLRELLTESERIMLGRRILIARLLLMSNSTEDICEKMRVGMDTVYRVERWLRAQFPGLKNGVKGLERELDRRKRRREASNPFTFAYLKRKYPLHFLLWNIADELRSTRKLTGLRRPKSTEGRFSRATSPKPNYDIS